jgi:hypothetical protein
MIIITRKNKPKYVHSIVNMHIIEMIKRETKSVRNTFFSFLSFLRSLHTWLIRVHIRFEIIEYKKMTTKIRIILLYFCAHELLSAPHIYALYILWTNLKKKWNLFFISLKSFIWHTLNTLNSLRASKRVY